MAGIVQAVNLSKQVTSPSVSGEGRPLAILQGVSFAVELGDSLAISGASGSGKATLLELNRAHGTTLILVTHDEALAQRCNRQLRLVAGRVA